MKLQLRSCALLLALAVPSMAAAQQIVFDKQFNVADADSVDLNPLAEAAVRAAIAESHLPFCTTGGPTLCLRGGRFSLGVGWELSDGTVGQGGAVQLTSDSGYFYFFSPSNIELVVKVLNACSPPFNRYWVFAAGLTNVRFVLAVVDRQADLINTYENPQGRPAPPLQDTNAFATCP